MSKLHSAGLHAHIRASRVPTAQSLAPIYKTRQCPKPALCTLNSYHNPKTRTNDELRHPYFFLQPVDRRPSTWAEGCTAPPAGRGSPLRPAPSASGAHLPFPGGVRRRRPSGEVALPGAAPGRRDGGRAGIVSSGKQRGLTPALTSSSPGPLPKPQTLDCVRPARLQHPPPPINVNERGRGSPQ